jgi:hypothetical protein
MSNASLVNHAVNRLVSQADAIGRLAQDGGGFAAVVAAFESRDAAAFRWVLERLEMLPYCEIICEWVRVKLCSLRCAEICRPVEKTEVPSLRQFARAIEKLSANEKVLRRVVDAVACGDAAQYEAALAELKLGEFCQLICYWVCSVGYHEVCHAVCRPEPVAVADPLLALRVAGEVIAGIAKGQKTLDSLGEALQAADFDTAQSAVSALGLGDRCGIFCLFLCVWWRVRVCRELCDVPPPIYTGPYAVDEARDFALASRQLAAYPRAMSDLVDAALTRNAQAYRQIVSRFNLSPYCWQLCSWVSSGICFGFCIRVCPQPGAYQPLFTTVGNFDIYTQIDPGSGLTNTSLSPPPSGMPWGGGPHFAFCDELLLGGTCPVFSPTAPGTPMQFRFLFASSTTTLPAAITAAQTSITVPGGVPTPTTPFNVAVCVCSANGATGETMTVTAVTGITWTVTRGTDGTTAATAPAGTTLLVGLTPITGAAVDTPLQIGQRTITWPANLPGNIAGAPTSTFEPVYVGYGTDPAAPILGSTYVSPKHYLEPDPATGWVRLDPALMSPAIEQFLNFNSIQAVVGGCSLPTPPCIGAPGGSPAASAASNPGAGSDLAVIFQATRQGVTAIDYSNSLCKIHINNWSEVNNLWFTQFATGCCTPIDSALSVQFTVDHEEMPAGAWSLGISSCALDESITPAVSTVGPPPVTVSGRGGYGTIDVDTSLWPNCSYTVTLSTRPGLTTGMLDRTVIDNNLTFAICDHIGTTLAAAITAAQTSIAVTASSGFPATPFNALLPSTGEIIQVMTAAGTSWTVTRGQSGTMAAAAAAGAAVSSG